MTASATPWRSPNLLARVTALAFVLALALPAFADGPVGQWRLTVDTPRGTRTPVLTIVAHADGYSGTLVGARGTQTLESVTVTGNRFSFPLEVTMPMGTMQMTYNGTTSGDTLHGTIGNPMGSIAFSGSRITPAD